MADVKIRVVGEDAASKEIGKVNKSLEEMKVAAGEAGESGKGMGVDWEMALLGINQGIQIAREAIELFKKAYEFAREGAELEYLETKFDNLATSIGTTSDSLLLDLREATRGLMSDSEMMSGATDMMALGLANTHDEAVRLAAVAGALNMSIDHLTLTLTNKSIRRFDTLGVSVAGFTERVKELEEAGMDADAAFKEAFLQQAEEQIERVGHAADSAAGAFRRLESGIKDLGDSIKTNFVNIALPAIKIFADELTVINANRAIEEMEQQLLNLGYTAEDIKGLWQGKTFFLFDEEGAAEAALEYLRILQGELDAAGESAEFARRMTDPFSESLDYAAEAAGRLAASASAMSALESALRGTEAAMRDLGIATEERNKMMEEYLLLTGEITEEELFLERVQRDLIQAWADGVISVKDYQTAMDEVIGLLEDGQIEVANYVLALAGIPSEIITKIITEYYEFDYGRIEAVPGGGRKGEKEHRVPNAAGGEIHAAAGLPVHWAGEMGPEPFIPAMSGRIVSNTQAVQTLRESGGYSGASQRPIQVVIEQHAVVSLADMADAERKLTPLVTRIVRKALAAA